MALFTAAVATPTMGNVMWVVSVRPTSVICWPAFFKPLLKFSNEEAALPPASLAVLPRTCSSAWVVLIAPSSALVEMRTPTVLSLPAEGRRAIFMYYSWLLPIMACFPVAAAHIRLRSGAWQGSLGGDRRACAVRLGS